MLNQSGTMAVRVYTAGGALPVEDAVVRILGAEEANRDVSYSLLTDRDGVTKTVYLPAPERSLSTSPEPPEAPYAIYDVEVSKDGYFKKKIYGAAVFADINSELLIEMTPTSSYPLPDYSEYDSENTNPDLE
ncbi:MAG: hypothetical protein IJX92_06510 [Clostridia bacterium]|nr:hypothetical protein [Clostridia bacterium]